jgi:hypothetical protein
MLHLDDMLKVKSFGYLWRTGLPSPRAKEPE